MKHFPSWRYHKELQPKIIHNEAQHELLESEGWAETPAAFLEPEIKKPISALDQKLEDLGPKDSERDQETLSESEIEEELSEDDIKATLREQGVSNKQMKNKSVDELKAMLA